MSGLLQPGGAKNTPAQKIGNFFFAHRASVITIAPFPRTPTQRTSPVRIGPYQLKNNLIVAPMAGVTDRPFRQLCKLMGAGMAVSEMVASNSLLWGSAKTLRRANHEGEVDPISVQIAGADPQMLADAARYNVDQGAQIIDINMGCPAKKVCNVMAGSALLKDEPLVARILEAVVGAVDVPVTLKIRTGWDRDHRNAIIVARIAESAGIQALAACLGHNRRALGAHEALVGRVALEMQRAGRIVWRGLSLRAPLALPNENASGVLSIACVVTLNAALTRATRAAAGEEKCT